MTRIARWPDPRTWLGLALAATLGVGLTAQTQTATSEDARFVSNQNGNYLDTHVADGGAETLTEAETGGKPNKRRSLLEHVWIFANVPAGDQVDLLVRAARPVNSEGDDFELSWSADGQSFGPTIATIDNDTLPAEPLGVTIAGPWSGGTIWIRVVDTETSQGNRVLDSVDFDYLALQVSGSNTNAWPDAPSQLAVTDLGPERLVLDWTDNSSNEDSFTIERSTDAVTWTLLDDDVPADTTTYLDEAVLPSTTYWYRVIAWNANGPSYAPGRGDPLPEVAHGTTREPGAFSVEFVADGAVWEGDGGIWAAHDTAGELAVLWHEFGPNMSPFLTESSGTSWSTTPLPPEPGSNASGLVFDSLNVPSYIAQDSGLKLYRRDPLTGWQTETIDTANSLYLRQSIAVDRAGGQLFAAYVRRGIKHNDPTPLCLARRTSTGIWTSEVVDPAPGLTASFGVSVAADPLGRPAIAYHASTGNGGGLIEEVRYAAWNGNEWTLQVLDTVHGAPITLAFDPVTGWPAVAYGVDPRVRMWDGASWQLRPLPEDSETNADAGVTLIAFGPDGLAYVCYTRSEFDAQGAFLAGSVIVRRWEGAAWSAARTVDTYQGPRHMASGNLSLDPTTGEIAVAYSDGGMDGLRVARRLIW